MTKAFLTTALLLSAGVLSGCETIKCTATGPFIGLSKDIANTREFFEQTRPLEKVAHADAWVQKNLW